MLSNNDFQSVNAKEKNHGLLYVLQTRVQCSVDVVVVFV